LRADGTGDVFTIDANGAGTIVTGSVGVTHPISQVAIVSSAATNVEFEGAVVNVPNLSLSDAGGAITVELDNPAMVFTGNIFPSSSDTLKVTDATSITGNLGTATHPLFAVEVTFNHDLEIDGHVLTDELLFEGNHNLTLSPGSTVSGPIGTAAGNNTGTLTLEGSFTTQNTIGILGAAPLFAVDVTGASGTVFSMRNPISAKNVNVNNGGTFLVTGTQVLDGALNLTNDSTLSLARNATFDIVTLAGDNGDFNIAAGSTIQVNMANIARPETPTSEYILVQHNATIDPNAQVVLVNPPFVPNGTTFHLLDSQNSAAGLNVVPVHVRSLLTHGTSLINGNFLDIKLTSDKISTFADQTNTVGVAADLDAIVIANIPTKGSLHQIIMQLGSFTDAEILNDELASLAPIVDGAILNESFMTQEQAFSVIENRFDRRHHRHLRVGAADNAHGYAAGDEEGNYYGAWVQAFGQHAHQKEREDIDGYTSNMGGFIGGFDGVFCESVLFGGAISWAELRVNDRVASSTKTTADSYQGTIYGQYDFSTYYDLPMYLDMYLGLAYNSYFTHRHINFGAISLIPRGHFHGIQAGGKAELSYVFGENAFHFIPLLSLYYSHLNLSSYTETGANTADLSVNEANYDTLLGGAGIEFAYDYECPLVLWQPEVHAKVFYDFDRDTMETTAQFTGAGPDFVTTGFNPARTSYNLGASLTAFTDEDWAITASYDFSAKSEYTAHSGFVKVHYAW